MNTDETLEVPEAPLQPAKLILRLTMIGMVLAGIAALFLYSGGWFTPHALSPAVMIISLRLTH